MRIHTDEAAASSAWAVNAFAYAVGRHIVFDAGAYAPASDRGRKLLAHELAHVLQQTGSGPRPGAQQERDAEATSNAVQAGTRPQLGAASRIGLAAQPKPRFTAGESWLTIEDLRLGIKVVTLPEIEAKVRSVIDRPGSQVNQGRADFNESPARARAHLYHSHFRDDGERLSYALGVFRSSLGAGGTVDPVELFGTMMAYEVQMQRRTADLVVHTPPTAAELQTLDQLRQQRRAELAEREAERARQEAEREAERARQEAERAKRAPEDLSKYDCPDFRATGSYSDQGLALPYDKLVPDPDPRKGYDEEEVRKTLREPRRLEQLYYDAANGVGKAAWLACGFETRVQQLAREGVHDVSDITDLRGAAHILLGTGGIDFGLLGFSPQTASGQRMFAVFSEAFAKEANDVRFSNTVLGNLASLWGAGRITRGALAKVDVPTPVAPLAPPAAPAPTTTTVPLRPPAQGPTTTTVPLRPPAQGPTTTTVPLRPPAQGPTTTTLPTRPPAPATSTPPAGPAPIAPQIIWGDVKTMTGSSYRANLKHVSEMEGRETAPSIPKYNPNGNIGIAMYDNKTGDVAFQVWGPRVAGQERKIIWEGPIGKIQIPPGRTPIQIGTDVEEAVRDLARKATGQNFPSKPANAPGPDLIAP